MCSTTYFYYYIYIDRLNQEVEHSIPGISTILNVGDTQPCEGNRKATASQLHKFI